MDFAQVKDIKITEGNVIKIVDSANRILWQKSSVTPTTKNVILTFTSTADTTVNVYYTESSYNSSTPDMTISLTANQKKTTDTGKEEIYKFTFTSPESITEAGVTGTLLTCKELFSSCMYLSTLDLTKLNTSKVTDMSKMFYITYSLTSLDVSSWDTSNVTTMSNMFEGSWIQTLDVSAWNTNNVENMDNMFNSADKLTTIGAVDTASGWQHKPNSFRGMFTWAMKISPKPSWWP